MESISTKILKVKTNAELGDAIILVAGAQFASKKTKRRWTRQIEKKQKELAK